MGDGWHYSLSSTIWTFGIAADTYCFILCHYLLRLFFLETYSILFCLSGQFHKAVIAWNGVRAENCVLASVRRVILSWCVWLTAG